MEQNKPGQTEELAAVLEDIAQKSRELVATFLARGGVPETATGDSLHLTRAFLELTASLMRDPGSIIHRQFDLWQDYVRLWHHTALRLCGREAAPVAVPERGDRRFKDPAWDDHLLFDVIKQSYLLTARYLLDLAQGGEGLDEKTRQKVAFYTRQFVDAFAPTNFVLSNPEVLRATVESRGANLLRGLKNMLEDLERGKGRLAIRMTDTDAFAIGRNLATTPGKVVFQNELMQLIQYAPATERVHERPLVIVPPWINKYYILDLQPKNSFIRYAVERGFTVFVLSWVNPDERLAHKTFDDYMREGPLAAFDAALRQTGARSLNAVGYCLGGTLLAATLAWMAAKRDRRVKSATFLTTLVDFSDPGELGVFIDEEQLAALEELMNRRGYLDGAEMATTFNLLRANDLIWSFVVNNYLLGRDPFPFDLLYWNSDSTRMPAAMHSFYLRAFYLENRLVQPGGVELLGVPIDLTRVRQPTYLVATKEDHIAPWKTTYAATQLYRGPKTFVLAGSGHIAGIINPPAADKYGYWLNPELPPDPEAWFDRAQAHKGSWWPHWAAWLAEHGGRMVEARDPASGPLVPLEDAPGSYVRVRAH